MADKSSRIVQILLQRGTTTDLADDSGHTPLIWAAINGHDNVVSDLLKSGANPNQPDKIGATALARAAR